MQLPVYLSKNFPDLVLGPDLFHSWTPGVRFELATGENLSIRLQTAVDRAFELYEATFSSNDAALIASVETCYEDTSVDAIKRLTYKPRHKPRNVFQISTRLTKLSGTAGKQQVVHREDKDVLRVETWRWTTIRPRAISYRYLLKCCAHQDFPGHVPRTKDRIFFVTSLGT